MTSSPSAVRAGMPPRVPPVAPGSFLLGSARELRRDMLGACEQAFHQYGDVVRLLVGPPGLRLELYLLSHPDAMQRVLASSWRNYRKENVFYSEVRGAFGDGVLTSQDGEWQRQMRFLQPLFTAKRVAGYAAVMSEQVRRRGMAPVRLPAGWPTPVNRRLARARQALHGVCDEIIARRRARSDRQEDLVGLLLDARDNDNALEDAEIRDQVLIFLLAGHETTSTALTFTLHLLGRHPSVQRRVREEVSAVVGDRTPTAQDAPALAYTAMVLKETMRLYPPAPLLGRRAVSDDQVCGYHIPAGTDVLLAPWVVHRHPEFWDEPGRFEPERFTPEREKARHRYAWCPFGGGPRGCMGQHFSMLESVIALAVLVRDFEFSAPPGEPRYTNHITLRPTHGMPSLVTPR